jgi:hypothetical protein
MTTSISKQLAYTISYKELQTNYDKNIYRNISFIDSQVLAKGDKILDSLGLHNFKHSVGAKSFEIEVYYYHGRPKD